MTFRAAALAAALAFAAAGCGAGDSRGTDTPGSTLRATLVDHNGDGLLEAGPGEPLLDRGGTGKAVRTLATFAQITDAHVRDEESPARLPFADRFGPPFTSAFRPQEALTTQVLDATVQTIDTLRPDALIETGDLADNAQRNELTAALATLHGGTVSPDSGAAGPSGPQLQSNPDPLLYRPDVDAPLHPGLLAAAQRPFTSPGLHAPWYAVFGNHDLLVQGELAPDARTQRLATGDRAVVSLPRDALRGVHIPGAQARGEGGVGSIGTPTIQQILDRGRTVRVRADPARREVTPGDAATLARRFGARANGGDSVFEIGNHGLFAIALDLVRSDGGSDGRVGPDQLRFLRDQLARAGRRPVVVFSHQALDHSGGGESALALLRDHPNVVAAIAGHTHRNEIKRAPGGGPWLITTASLVDFPQQARAFRLVQAADGRVALETWMLDHGPGPGGLATTSRDLAFLDAQGGRPNHFAGARKDRNVRLWGNSP